MNFKPYVVVCGHYGCGKTNLAINIANDLSQKGNKVVIVDLDIVNPYFRSSDYKNILKNKGVNIISPQMANTTLDAPAISAEIYTVFDNPKYDHVIFDVGGDDAGAAVLGRFSQRIKDSNDYEVLYLVNKYRKLISEPEDALAMLKDIEAISRLKVTHLVNNSHLSYYTDLKTLTDSIEYVNQISKESGLPVKFTSVKKDIDGKLSDYFDNIYETEIVVNPPWQ